MNVKGTKKKNQVVTANIFEQQELLKKAEVIRENLTASTWRELETNGKFDKNEKLSFISDDMLILGCDVGSETHYMRAIDTRGRELSKSAFPFNNDYEGFQSAKEWAVKIAAEHEKSQIVLGLEPTGHYWFCLATWMISNGISVVQVNPYAVKQTKEVEDNSQLKDDRKDPKLIANLVKDGNFGMPYLPEKLYAELRRLSMFRDQLNEDRIRTINRMHREMKIYFPEYKDALGKVDGAFSLELLKQAPFPDDLIALGEDGIRKIWHADWMQAELREEAEFTIADLLSFPKDQKIIVDGIIPLDILKEISDYEHVFLLFAPDEMKLQHYFDRADKDEVYQFILSFPDGKELLDNVIEALNLDNEQERRNMLESGFKFLERTDHDTVEGTLKIIEKHFGL